MPVPHISSHLRLTTHTHVVLCRLLQAGEAVFQCHSGAWAPMKPSPAFSCVGDEGLCGANCTCSEDSLRVTCYDLHSIPG